MSGLHRACLRLRQFSALEEGELCRLAAAIGKDLEFSAGEDLARERQPTTGLLIVQRGFAGRYKMLPDGRRQIVGLLLPGDLCDLRAVLSTRMVHSITALGPASAALIPSAAAASLIVDCPQLMRAFWSSMMVDHAISCASGS